VEIQCLELTLFYFGFERLCFQGPTCILNNATHSQVSHFKICRKSVLYKGKRCTKFYFFTYRSHRDTQLQVEVSIPRPCTWLVYRFCLSWSYFPPTCGIFCLTFLGIKWLQLQFLIAVPLPSSVPVPDTHLAQGRDLAGVHLGVPLLSSEPTLDLFPCVAQSCNLVMIQLVRFLS